MKTIYEPHPVSHDRKAELRAQGFKIIDAIFAPKDEATPSIPSREDIAGMKRSEVVEWLQAHGVESPKGRIEDLRAALERAIYL